MMNAIVCGIMKAGRLTFALCLLSLFVNTSTAEDALIVDIVSIPGQPHIQVRPNPSMDGHTLTLTCVPGALVSDDEEENEKEKKKSKRPLTSFGLPDRVVWLNDSRKMRGLHSESISTRADFDSPGWFQCQRGSSDRLSLPFVPRVSHLLISPQSAMAVEDGQHMTLTCLTSAKVKSKTFAMLDWSKNDHEIKDSSRQDFTFVANVSDPSFFHCKVSSGGKTFLSPPFLPQIYPRRARICRSLHQLICDTPSTMFIPVYLWFLNRNKVDNEYNATLDLQSLGARYGDRFTCQVKEKWQPVFSQLSHEYVLKGTIPKILHSRKELRTTLESRAESECQSEFKPSFTTSSYPFFKSKPSFTTSSYPIIKSKPSFTTSSYPIFKSKSSFRKSSPTFKSKSSFRKSSPIFKSKSDRRSKSSNRGFKNRVKGFRKG